MNSKETDSITDSILDAVAEGLRAIIREIVLERGETLTSLVYMYAMNGLILFSYYFKFYFYSSYLPA